MRAAILSLCMLLGALAVYAATQQPSFSLTGENFGLILRRGHYRSWLLHWYDGRAWEPPNKLTPVVMNEDGTIRRPGYRIIPRFTHVDEQQLKQLTNKHFP